MVIKNALRFGSLKQSVAVHFCNDEIVRLMQVEHAGELSLHSSFEVPVDDPVEYKLDGITQIQVH